MRKGEKDSVRGTGIKTSSKDLMVSLKNYMINMIEENIRNMRIDERREMIHR